MSDSELAVEDCDCECHKEDSAEAEDMGNCGACCSKGASKLDEPQDKYAWEQNVLDELIMKPGESHDTLQIDHSAIISFSNAQLRAAAPRGFRPNKQALKNIVAALKGDTSELAEHGINLGSGTRTSVPGKMDAGKAIYGSDGKGGGCTVFKSKECVLIVVYENDPAHATRIAREVAEHMEENGH